MAVLAYESEVRDVVRQFLALCQLAAFLAHGAVVALHVLDDAADQAEVGLKLRDDVGDGHGGVSLEAANGGVVLDDALSNDKRLRYGLAFEQIVEGPQEVEHLNRLTEGLLEDASQARDADLTELGSHLHCSILNELPEDGQAVLLVLCVPRRRVAEILLEIRDNFSLSLLDDVVVRSCVLLLHLALLGAGLEEVLEGLESELFEELKELVVILRGGYCGLIESRPSCI